MSERLTREQVERLSTSQIFERYNDNVDWVLASDFDALEVELTRLREFMRLRTLDGERAELEVYEAEGRAVVDARAALLSPNTAKENE